MVSFLRSLALRVKVSGGRAVPSWRLGGCCRRSGTRSYRASHWNQRMPIPANTTM